jgi:hypothetical protein
MKNTLEQKMREYVKAWECSGLRQVDFCKAHGLRKDQFYYWKAKFQRKEVTEGKIGFQEISLPKAIKQEISGNREDVFSMELKIQKYFRIRLSFHFNLGYRK